MNVPTTPELRSVNLEESFGVDNSFTAHWTVENARANDLVSLYLAETPVDELATVDMNGDAVLQPSDPGLLLAKDIPVDYDGDTKGSLTSGSYNIDVTQVSLLGGTEDIRGLLRQGNYFLRAELKSEASYDTTTSPARFLLV